MHVNGYAYAVVAEYKEMNYQFKTNIDMKNESNNTPQAKAMPYDAMLGTVISNEEISRKKCLDCGYDGGEVGKDSCVNCGCRYEPTEGNENCPNCGCDDYDTHCPKCDSDNIVYWNEAEKN